MIFIFQLSGRSVLKWLYSEALPTQLLLSSASFQPLAQLHWMCPSADTVQAWSQPPFLHLQDVASAQTKACRRHSETLQARLLFCFWGTHCCRWGCLCPAAEVEGSCKRALPGCWCSYENSRRSPVCIHLRLCAHKHERTEISSSANCFLTNLP